MFDKETKRTTMRKFITTAAIITAIGLSAPALAEEAEMVIIDLDTFCADGCTVTINFTDDARYIDTAISGAGHFTHDARDNPFAYVSGLAKTDTDMTEFVLSSEPGAPRFRSIEQVQSYITGQDALMQRALRLQRQNSNS